MDYMVFALLLVCCFKGWIKGLLFSLFSLIFIVVLLLLVVKNTEIGQVIVQFMTDTKLSGMLYKNVVEKIINLF